MARWLSGLSDALVCLCCICLYNSFVVVECSVYILCNYSILTVRFLFGLVLLEMMLRMYSQTAIIHYSNVNSIPTIFRVFVMFAIC